MATLVGAGMLNAVQQQAKTLVHRSLDRHVRLAVTGLSRSGKTAFITALVHQLQQLDLTVSLPHWQVVQSGRWIGGRQVPQRYHHIPTFQFDAAKAAILATPPTWPAPTRAVSEIRLELRYHSGSLLRRHMGHSLGTLYLDIVDYPGEWLLDLPLLALNYQQWSQQVTEQLARPQVASLAQDWAQGCRALDPSAPFDEQRLAPLVAAYKAWLLDCRYKLGLSLIQPGRFVLPGEHEGAPVLQFIPWVGAQPTGSAAKGSVYAMLEERYEHYKQHLVKRFYQEHFSTFDRQIVLVDCLQTLCAGPQAFDDLEQTMAQLLGSFHYGRNNWLQRLFAPRIDKLLFVASKADHVTPEQHGALQQLLRQLVYTGYGQARFEGIDIHCLAMASVMASRYLQAEWQGQTLPVLQGVSQEGAPVRLFPGAVPAGRPDLAFWQRQSADPEHGFGLVPLRPPVLPAHAPWPNIRMDAALEFLLGDKML